MVKSIFILLGTLSLGLGLAGIFIPGLPTTPFILLTAGLYVRSSEKLYQMLIQNEHIGKYIREFQTYKGMTVETKLFSITIMWLMILLSTFLLIHVLVMKILVLVIGMVGTIVMGFLIPTIRKGNHTI